MNRRAPLSPEKRGVYRELALQKVFPEKRILLETDADLLECAAVAAWLGESMALFDVSQQVADEAGRCLSKILVRQEPGCDPWQAGMDVLESLPPLK